MKIKKILWQSTLILLIMCLFGAFFASADEITYGDVNCNEVAGELSDVIVLGKYLGNKCILTDEQKLAANVYKEDVGITANDLVILVKYSFGEINQLPVPYVPENTETSLSTTVNSRSETDSGQSTTVSSDNPGGVITSNSLIKTLPTDWQTSTTNSVTTTTSESTLTSTSTTETTSETTIPSSETTSATTVVTNDFELQVPIYQYIYGSWLESAINVIKERAGLSINKDFDLYVSLEDLGDSGTVAQCGVESSDFTSFNRPALRFRIDINSQNIDYDTEIPYPDGKMPNISNGNTNVDQIFTHEVTHGLTYLNFTYKVLVSQPDWYVEGLAEAVAGSDRLFDYTDKLYYFYYQNQQLSGQTWELMQLYVRDFMENQENIYTYYVGNLMTHWLDNYGTNSGEFTSQNGGRIKNLNAVLMRGVTFSSACQQVFGNTSAELLAQFKSEIAAIQTYEEWIIWANDKCNIQCNDGLNDALCNSDASSTDIIPNGEPEYISKIDTLEVDSYTIKLIWSFD